MSSGVACWISFGGQRPNKRCDWSWTGRPSRGWTGADGSPSAADGTGRLAQNLIGLFLWSIPWSYPVWSTASKCTCSSRTHTAPMHCSSTCCPASLWPSLIYSVSNQNRNQHRTVVALARLFVTTLLSNIQVQGCIMYCIFTTIMLLGLLWWLLSCNCLAWTKVQHD